MSYNLRDVVELPDVSELSATDQTLTWAWTGADITGTWTGTIRETVEATTAEAPAVTVNVTYSSPDSSIAVTLSGAALALLIPAGDKTWEGWLGVSRSETPVYGLEVPIRVHQVVNR